MAVLPAALLAPTGALTPELLLPLRSLVDGAVTAADVAQAYAQAGTAKVAGWTDAARADRGGVAWAHHRALSDRAQQILTAAASLSSDGDARAYATSQAVELNKLAAAWLATFTAEQAAEFPAVTAGGAPRSVSRSTRVEVAF